MIKTTNTEQNKFAFLDEYTVGEYDLSINKLTGKEADELADEIKQAVIKEFKALNPVICRVYDFEIEESEVIYGSRKSKHKGKLKKKKGKTLAEKLKNSIGTFMFVLSLSSTDYSQISKNWHIAVETVESVFKNKQQDINMKDVKSYPLEDSPSRKDSPENPNIT